MWMNQPVSYREHWKYNPICSACTFKKGVQLLNVHQLLNVDLFLEPLVSLR